MGTDQFFTVQNAIEDAILARGVDPPEDLADIIFVAALAALDVLGVKDTEGGASS